MTEEQRNAYIYLHQILKPGSEVYTTVTHRSRSGMLRWVKLYVVAEGKIEDITLYAARVLRDRMDDKGIKVPVCGFSAGPHVVYALGSALWSKGTKELHGTRNGEPDTSGEYALKQREL